MKKLIDYIEPVHLYNFACHAMSELNKTIDFDLYDSLQDMARDTCNLIEDDAMFCDAEWNLFQEWYDEKGFTDEDWKYVDACGYCEDQFGGEDYDDR